MHNKRGVCEIHYNGVLSNLMDALKTPRVSQEITPSPKST